MTGKTRKWFVSDLYLPFGLITCDFFFVFIGLFTYFLGALGITAGAHRLWAHRSYKAKTPLRVFLAFCNFVAFQVSFCVVMILLNMQTGFLCPNFWILIKKQIKVMGPDLGLGPMEPAPYYHHIFGLEVTDNFYKMLSWINVYSNFVWRLGECIFLA